MSRINTKAAWVLIGCALLLAIFTRLLIGSTGVGLPNGEHAGILMDIRVQRGVVRVWVRARAVGTGRDGGGDGTHAERDAAVRWGDVMRWACD